MVHAIREPEPGQTAAARAAPEARTPRPGMRGLGRQLDPASLLALQRGAGNAAVNRVLQRCATDECACGGADDRAAAAASTLLSIGLRRKANRERDVAQARLMARGPRRSAGPELQTRSGRPNETPPGELQTKAPGGPQRLLQRDLALEVPRPRAVGRALTAAQMQAAIRFNDRVVTVVGAEGLKQLRDVLGVSPEPAVIDEAFVNAVVQWQAWHRLTQDGQLGPASARTLFREMGAESVARGEVETGPTYTPTGTIAPPVVGGNQHAHFDFRARFRHDPANGVYASCCELRQHILWDAASAAALPGGRPHAGFPAGAAANTWFEDRDAANSRYGHRTGPHSDPQNFDQYIDTNGRRNQAFGHLYRGDDTPGGPDALLAGSWRFRISVVDVCNGGRRVGGQDFVRVNW